MILDALKGTVKIGNIDVLHLNDPDSPDGLEYSKPYIIVDHLTQSVAFMMGKHRCSPDHIAKIALEFMVWEKRRQDLQ